ncbi:MAG TPA: hypothetical protein VN976_15810 [Verrucomicrobiae bacterium]|nr:hypothetical protein [Verrucomicrobiae bacterium]
MFEPNFHLGRGRVRWERVFFFITLIAVPAILSSCGSSASTAVAPSITASCVPTQGTGADVTVLGTAQCTATVLNASSTLVNWSVSGTGNGSIDKTSGLYTAPATVPSTNVVTITATSQVQSTLTATASLTIVAATAITAVVCNDSTGSSPSPLVVSSLNSLSCTAFASVSSGTTVPVNWSVANKNNPGSLLNLGGISTLGVYTAPLVPPPGQMVSITATSKALSTETMSVTATVVFGNAVLSGPYAFSTSGRLPTHAFWARVGSLSAGGGSLIGIEDTNQGGTPNTVTTQRSFTGSYSIGPDGRGTMQFCEGTSAACPQGPPATAYFNIVVISPQHIQMIEFSKPVTPPPTTATAGSAAIIAGGEMIAQDQSVFSAGAGNLSGTYSFNFAGVSTSATEESVLGEFNANGHGTISQGSPTEPGEMDINPTPVSLPAPLALTTYSISSNGRGTVTLNNGTVNLTFSIYPVSASRAKFIEIDTASLATPTVPASILVGDAYIQQTSSTCGWALNALSGPTVFETSGLNSLGGSPGVVIGDIGNFTADGTTGAVSAASIDENSGGTVSSTVGTLTGNYTVDSCGRGTLTIGGHSYVFYIISPSDAVLQESTTGIIAHGFMLPSNGGPFVDTTLTGNYGFRLGGTDAAGTTGNREDLLGQVTSAGLGTGLAGTLDLNDFGATQTPVAIANGTYLGAPAGSLRATMNLPLSTISGATTRNLVLYMVSPKLFYVLDTDPAPAGTAVGVINNQF